MAEDRDSQTEAPTAKKKRDAANKGDVLQSRDLAAALTLVAGVAWLTALGPLVIESLRGSLRQGLRLVRADVVTFDPLQHLAATAQPVLLPLAALAGLTLFAAFAAPALLGSLGFRAGAFAVQPGKMNPLSGLKRMFGPDGWTELGKSFAKVALILAMGWWTLRPALPSLLGLAASRPEDAAAQVGDVFLTLVLRLAGALLLLGVIDGGLQWRRRFARLRMSRHEVREEAKEADGNPENKRHAAARRHEILNASARKAVTEANVVLTNPTHFAVALRYQPGRDAAPIVVARGRGDTALAIRALADEAEVPRLEYPELTRAIYFTTRAGRPVAPELYVAVATVLAFVFRLDAAVGAAMQPDIAVPEGKRFDERGQPLG